MKPYALAALLACVFLVSCVNPIDMALDEALDPFSGFFQASDGTQVEVVYVNQGLTGTIYKVGTSKPDWTQFYNVGNEYFGGLTASGSGEGRFVGDVVGKSGMYGMAIVTVNSQGMTIEPNNVIGLGVNVIPGHASWNRIPKPSTPPSGGGGGGGGGSPPPSGDGRVVLSQTVRGDAGSRTYFSVNVPSGTTRMEVVLSETEHGRNLADLFVRRGSQPTVSTANGYSWNVGPDGCASIEPNRQRERCNFTNPASGTWHILVYGYHEYYGSLLTVTLWP